MSNPNEMARPETEQVKTIIEEETGYSWTLHINDPDELVFNSEVYQFVLRWIDSGWRFEVYDPTDSKTTDDEPRWALGKVKSNEKLYKELRSFVPLEIKN